MVKLAKEFEDTLGSKLQRYLLLKSWWSTNYVSDWWEEYVYLRGRSPLMINSNFYGIEAIYLKQTSVQSARAANISYLLLLFRRRVERQELEPVSIFILKPHRSISLSLRICWIFFYAINVCIVFEYFAHPDHGSRFSALVFVAIRAHL